MKELNTTYLKIVLLFTIVVGSTEIVLGQSSLPTDTNCICYTDEMDKRCLECLINSPKKDSLISNYSLQINNYKQITLKQGTLVKDLETLRDENQNTIQKLGLKNTRLKRTTKVATLAGVLVGFLTATVVK